MGLQNISKVVMATPYSLVYGMEAVLPVELEVPSLRVAMESQITEVDWIRNRYDELALLDEKRLRALYHVQGYQRRVARAFNKHVKDRGLKKGDVVLKEIRAPVFDPRGKFKPSWGGPTSSKRYCRQGLFASWI